MKFTQRLHNFDDMVMHGCIPSRQLGRKYKCPVCHAKWKTSRTIWEHSTDGTEGQILSIVVGYPDGTRQVFVR